MFIRQSSPRFYDILKINALFFYLKILTIDVIFYVFLDLCLFRRWKNVKLLYDKFLQFYIISFNPKKKKSLEFFFPVSCCTRIVWKNFRALFVNFLNIFDKKINLVFVDQNTTIVYYFLNFNFHKSFGPYLNSYIFKKNLNWKIF